MKNFARKTLLACSTALAFAGASVTSAPAASPQPEQDAWTIMVSEPQFSDVVMVIKYAGLFQCFQSDRFTAFIPTNAAFDRNPEVIPDLMIGHGKAFPDTTLAVNFVRSHVLYDLHPLSEFSGRTQTLTAISGSPISIDGENPGSYVVSWISVQSKLATAHVIDAPILATNAVIYPVDTAVLTDPQGQ